MNIDAQAADACCASLAETALSDGEAAAAAALFKVLGDPTRVRIVNLLATAGTTCVCDITTDVGLSQPTVSFHLKKLLGAGLVERQQRGKWAHYSLRPGALPRLASVLDSERDE